jgi:hypothetical protein
VEPDQGVRVPARGDDRSWPTGDDGGGRGGNAVDEGLGLLGDGGGSPDLGPGACREKSWVSCADRVGCHEGDKSCDVTVLRGCEEGFDDLDRFRAVAVFDGLRVAEFGACPAGQLLRRVLVRVERRGDLFERDGEEVVQDVRHPLFG